MRIEFLAPAEIELIDASSYYNIQSEGLGFEFAAEVKKTIERIIQHPGAWTKLSKRTRRCRTNRFPYGVIYQIKEETILIVAVMHLSRDPQTWKARLKGKEI
jgi:hypothetical protein